jgi:cytochrome c553
MPTIPTIIATTIAGGVIAAVLNAPAQAQGAQGAQGAPANIETKAQMCNVCHGQNGVPLDPKTMPIIWGQQVYLMVKALHDYRTGARENPIMSTIAKGLQNDELRPMAAYFAAKSWPAKQGSAPAGEPPKGVAQCQACHQKNFEGAPSGPRLAGQSYEYLIAAMRNYANDQRTGNEDMPKVMKALSDGEREAIAHYIAGL